MGGDHFGHPQGVQVKAANFRLGPFNEQLCLEPGHVIEVILSRLAKATDTA